MARMVSTDQTALMEQMEQQVLKAHKAQREPMATTVLMVQLALKVYRVSKA